ncbi:GTP-sensing pleiotropic transcriptional regulator CodY [Pelosinus fermentans]|uniref:Global transcriptional regulator CodY n=1 Tax=Pelosinus fermentans JBW45 TaxID=1192197 RepID=I8TNN7_9FIRM|nr:GTP-sensing pleiotropic transcriptional regulator CodY [Pelosinus fermentans]AJQ29074.1 GTP-sensing pleiotropic transcriptional repressor CodY [Pelosinus fermentans JBW45]
MKSLLERTRKINKLLQKSEKVEYAEMSTLLSTVMGANIYIISKDGKLLGYACLDNFECDLMRDKVLLPGIFPAYYVEWLLRVNETSPNLTLKDGLCAFSKGEPCLFNDKFTTIVPIHGVGQRIGTLIVAKFHTEFNDDDLILAEYGATVVGMEFLRDRSGKIEEEARKKAIVQVAIGTLSYSELEAVTHILNELDGNEGLLVASKIADHVGITRSVIVNALRKFESAGVIESQSLGMKGTFIKVLNDRLFEELKNLKN